MTGCANTYKIARGSTRDASDLELEPLDATFRDSTEAPLHSWFPYLEGYSPRFVERVYREYLPGARRIIEPFAGSGTTPLVLGQLGVECAFAEANPAMALVARTKLSVLEAGVAERHRLASSLKEVAESLFEILAECRPDESLLVNYEKTFGKSIFFDDDALEEILRLRTLNSALAQENRLLGDCFTVAVMSSLIPSSRLKRAGDLRFRTPKELALGLPKPTKLVCNKIAQQAEEVLRSERLAARAFMACSTAGKMHEHLDCEWDGVITSPPYLNGTNYIRNARLELWYLRHLSENADLRRLRNEVITSGINDVHAKTRCEPVVDGVARTVHELERNAYDSRIAKMVAGYFQDMADVLISLGKCVRPGGRICIDIGDSIYNGVHVPTDDLLVEVAEQFGYSTIDRVYLRKRISKGGATVRQQLLVFER